MGVHAHLFCAGLRGTYGMGQFGNRCRYALQNIVFIVITDHCCGRALTVDLLLHRMDDGRQQPAVRINNPADVWLHNISKKNTFIFGW